MMGKSLEQRIIYLEERMRPRAQAVATQDLTRLSRKQQAEYRAYWEKVASAGHNYSALSDVELDRAEALIMLAQGGSVANG